MWIEIFVTLLSLCPSLCHFPCGSVDWNDESSPYKGTLKSHFPCGSVDWNFRECREYYLYPVTSLAEVWIEMMSSPALLHNPGVTSLAEVWIEIWMPHLLLFSCMSLPLRKCGLKFGNCWHEWCGYKSLPLRKCGLKLPCLTSLCSFFLSLPLRKCGLKSKASGISILSTAVTSLAEVWIEILNKNVTAPIAAGHFPCGSVDWNIFRLLSRYPSHSHFPCGSVDWNTEHIVLSCWLLKVTSLAEVWIEIRYNPGTYWIWLCHFPCGSVDWNMAFCASSDLTNRSLPLRKCGLKSVLA